MEFTKKGKFVAGAGQRRAGQKRWLTKIQLNDHMIHSKQKHKGTDTERKEGKTPQNGNKKLEETR